MKKIILITLISLLSYTSYAQINYEKGYFIDNEDNRTVCLIKNIDWKNNPSEFKYKLSENSESKIATIKTVKEFGVFDMSKYEKFTVNIDRSSDVLVSLSTVKKPVFKKEQLFLKVLVEGKANLYSYEDGNLKRFFFKINNLSIEQLIYKRYKITDTKIGINNRYKQQLWNNLKCQTILLRNLENISYKNNGLISFFVKYNKCNNTEYINLREKQKKNLINLTLRPGLNASSLTIQNSSISFRNAAFDNEIGLRFGVEAEFIMSFNKNKWALIIEPTYQYYKSEKKLNTSTVTVDYQSIEIPIGIRHYFFLNDKSKIFINSSYIFDFSLNSRVNFEPGTDLEISKTSNITFGLGYSYKKYSLEFRYGFSRNILPQYIIWESNYNSSSIIFGYTLF